MTLFELSRTLPPLVENPNMARPKLSLGTWRKEEVWVDRPNIDTSHELGKSSSPAPAKAARPRLSFAPAPSMKDRRPGPTPKAAQ